MISTAGTAAVIVNWTVGVLSESAPVGPIATAVGPSNRSVTMMWRLLMLTCSDANPFAVYIRMAERFRAAREITDPYATMETENGASLAVEM
jgi:hypothetical protein